MQLRHFFSTIHTHYIIRAEFYRTVNKLEKLTESLATLRLPTIWTTVNIWYNKTRIVQSLALRCTWSSIEVILWGYFKIISNLCVFWGILFCLPNEYRQEIQDYSWGLCSLSRTQWNFMEFRALQAPTIRDKQAKHPCKPLQNKRWRYIM